LNEEKQNKNTENENEKNENNSKAQAGQLPVSILENTKEMKKNSTAKKKYSPINVLARCGNKKVFKSDDDEDSTGYMYLLVDKTEKITDMENCDYLELGASLPFNDNLESVQKGNLKDYSDSDEELHCSENNDVHQPERDCFEKSGVDILLFQDNEQQFSETNCDASKKMEQDKQIGENIVIGTSIFQDNIDIRKRKEPPNSLTAKTKTKQNHENAVVMNETKRNQLVMEQFVLDFEMETSAINYWPVNRVTQDLNSHSETGLSLSKYPKNNDVTCAEAEKSLQEINNSHGSSETDNNFDDTCSHESCISGGLDSNDDEEEVFYSSDDSSGYHYQSDISYDDEDSYVPIDSEVPIDGNASINEWSNEDISNEDKPQNVRVARIGEAQAVENEPLNDSSNENNSINNASLNVQLDEEVPFLENGPQNERSSVIFSNENEPPVVPNDVNFPEAENEQLNGSSHEEKSNDDDSPVSPMIVENASISDRTNDNVSSEDAPPNVPMPVELPVVENVPLNERLNEENSIENVPQAVTMDAELPAVDSAPPRERSNEENELFPDLVCKYKSYGTLPVRKDLSGVPAMLKMDVDSVVIFSKSLCKIVANMNLECSGQMNIDSSINRLRVNDSSRLYVQPDNNFKLKLLNGNAIKSPVRLPRFPNIRLFEIRQGSFTFTFNLYILDTDRRIGKFDCKMTDHNLVAIATAFNVVRLHCRKLQVLQVFSPSERINEIAQIIQALPLFFVNKKDSMAEGVKKSVDLHTGMAFLLLFEKALHHIAYEEWIVDYHKGAYNGHFTSSNSDHESKQNVIKWAVDLCQRMFFNLQAIGMKNQFTNRKEAMITDLADTNQFTIQHKKLCRDVSAAAKEQIFSKQERNHLIPNGMNHTIVTSFDVGAELHPLIPGTNFVINGYEGRTMYNHILQRTDEQESIYENALKDHLQCTTVENMLETKCCAYKTLPCAPMPAYYTYDAECFSDPKLALLFDIQGNPHEGNTVMDGLSGNLLVQQDPPGSRVIKLDGCVYGQYIPKPFRIDEYLTKFFDVKSENDLIAGGMPIVLPRSNDDDDESVASGGSFLDLLNHMRDDPNLDEEYHPDGVGNTVSRFSAPPGSVSVADAIHDFVDVIGANASHTDNLETNSSNSENQTGDAEHATEPDFDDDSYNGFDLAFMAESINIGKKSKIYSQFLSDNAIGNIHHDRVILSIGYTQTAGSKFQLTCRLHDNLSSNCCAGVNVYSPFTRQLFLDPSSKRHKIDFQLVPHLLQQTMCDVFEQPDLVHDYQKLKISTEYMKTKMISLLTTLQQTDRLPIRQELTFATESLWADVFKWPVGPNTMPVTAHIGICEAIHMYYFTKEIYEESMVPLSHMVRGNVMPDYTTLSPQSKTALVLHSERLIHLFQAESFRGQISGFIKTNFPDHPESSPPANIIVAISSRDGFNTHLRYGINSLCLPTYAVNPAKLTRRFRVRQHSTKEVYMMDFSKQVHCAREYLFHRNAILATLQEYSKQNAEFLAEEHDGMSNDSNGLIDEEIEGDDEVGDDLLDNESVDEQNLGDDVQEAITCHGYFDPVDFQKLSQLPLDKLRQLFAQLSRVLLSGYGIFWLSRITEKFKLPLERLPSNTTEMQDLSETKLRLSTSKNMPTSVPDCHRKDIICPGKYLLLCVFSSTCFFFSCEFA